jgi:hypothetical protein
LLQYLQLHIMLVLCLSFASSLLVFLNNICTLKWTFVSC